MPGLKALAEVIIPTPSALTSLAVKVKVALWPCTTTWRSLMRTR